MVPDKLLSFEFAALWLNACDATAEEEYEFELHLQKEARPPPIHSPTLQQPCVDWTNLSPSQHRNLPTPEEMSVQGCSQEPSFYTNTELDMSSSYNRKVPSWEKRHHPYGSLFGFVTNMGVVAAPNQSLYGYRCQGGIIPVNLSTRLTRNLKTSHEIFVGSPALCTENKLWVKYHRKKYFYQNNIPVIRND